MADCSVGDYLKRVGVRAQKERRRQNLSLRGVAQRCGVSKDSVQMLESGNNVLLGTAFEVALGLGIAPGALLNPFSSDVAEVESSLVGSGA
jgi:transcriptional regulator with XRE-family HTH domain